MNQKYIINKNIHYQLIDDLIFILDVKSGEYYELSESASEIWQLISDDISYQEIVEMLSGQYKNIDINIDILNLINELVSLNLISIIECENN